jgi:hypothetical protein
MGRDLECQRRWPRVTVCSHGSGGGRRRRRTSEKGWGRSSFVGRIVMFTYRWQLLVILFENFGNKKRTNKKPYFLYY